MKVSDVMDLIKKIEDYHFILDFKLFLLLLLGLNMVLVP